MYLLLLVTLLDGSQVNLKVKDDLSFDVATKYGALKIPLKDIRDVNVGVHVDNPKDFEGAAKALGNEKYGDRAAATKFLKDNPRGAWKYIQPLQKDPDPEVYKRVEQLTKDMDRPPILDNVALAGTYMAGDIKQTEIEGVSDSLGPLKIKMSQIKLIVMKQPGRDMELDASTEAWIEVEHVYDGRVTIVASGEIDLWPQTPGQYRTTPKGYSTAGKGGSYMAGALVGRGSDGKEFLIGENFSTVNFPRGKLEVRIVGNPWNGPSGGKYQLKIE
jgi:hypothetical protein